MASRLKLLNHPAKSPQPRGRHHKNVLQEMKIKIQRVCLVVISLFAVACGGPKSKTTKSDSQSFTSLADKKEFIERYVKFRRTYEALDFLIDYRDGGDGGLPGPTEWDIRLVATVPANEIEAWMSDLPITKEAETDWVSGIANAPTNLNTFEWHLDKNRTVGIDRLRRIVLYRHRTL